MPPFQEFQPASKQPTTAKPSPRRNNLFKSTASNLNGTKLDDYLKSNKDNVAENNNFCVQPNMDENEEYVAKELPENDFFIRLMIPMEKRKHAHIPNIARELFFNSAALTSQWSWDQWTEP